MLWAWSHQQNSKDGFSFSRRQCHMPLLGFTWSLCVLWCGYCGQGEWHAEMHFNVEALFFFFRV